MNNIRPFHTNDLEALGHIFNLNVPDFFDPSELSDFEKFIQKTDSNYYIVEHQEKIIGGGGYYLTSNNTCGHISWIFFHPHYKKQGYGFKLVTFFMNTFSAINSLERLETTTSQHAYLFFKKFGFKLSKTQKDYWGKGLDLYLMEKQL